MRTSSECITCFRSQVRKTVNLVNADQHLEQQVILETDRLLSGLDFSLSPPENAVALYGLIADMTGVPDPYKILRNQSNRMALGMRNDIRREIEQSNNPLKTAMHFAVAANIIDYGTRHDFDAMETLTNCLNMDFIIDDSKILTDELSGRNGLNVFYLADNSGEIVFDGLLVEQLQKAGCKVIMGVRETPILNDVTIEDTEFCGIDTLCQVIANGTGCPGTPLKSCSDSFQAVFDKSDIIISKGQGNFETLSEFEAPIYFLLTVKCSVVGRHILEIRGSKTGRQIGVSEMVIMKRNV